MGDAPQDSGYIKLWRSLKENGHLHMPATAFKVFIFLILQVNRKPGAGCERGEGWITYDLIREECSEEGTTMPNSTIKRALDYLEERRYIARELNGQRGAQKVRVLKYSKYQDQYLNDTSQVTSSIATIPVTIPVTIPKQECIQDKDASEEEEEECVREVRPENRDNWGRAYQDLFVLAPKATFYSSIQRLIEKAGMKDSLVVAVLERAVRLKKPNPPEWAKTVLTGLVPYGVTTVEEWQAFEADQNREQEEQEASRPSRGDRRKQPRSNVILDRQRAGKENYDYIYRKFDKPGGDSGG